MTIQMVKSYLPLISPPPVDPFRCRINMGELVKKIGTVSAVAAAAIALIAATFQWIPLMILFAITPTACLLGELWRSSQKIEKMALMYFKSNMPLSPELVKYGQNNSRFVKKMIQGKANLNRQDSEGGTLMHGVTSPHTAKILLANGARTNIPNDNKMTALEVTVKEKRTKVLEAILQSEAGKPEHHSQDNIWKYVKDKKTVKLLHEKGFAINPSQYTRTPLMWAAHNNAREVIQELLDLGSSLHATTHDGKQALHFTSDPTTASLLLRKGAKCNPDNPLNWHLHLATTPNFAKEKISYELSSEPTHHYKVALALVRNGAPVDEAALTLAFDQGYKGKWRDLIDAMATRPNLRQTALTLAAGREECKPLLAKLLKPRTKVLGA